MNSLLRYRNVFVEPAENTFDLYGQFKIFHNCVGGTPSWTIKLLEYDTSADSEYLCIDEDSFLFLNDIFERNVVDFDCYSYWNPIKPEVYRRIRTEITRLIEELSDEKKTLLTKNCMNFSAPILKAEKGSWESFLKQKQTVIDFCRAFLWYFDEYKQFQFDTCDRILNFSGW